MRNIFGIDVCTLAYSVRCRLYMIVPVIQDLEEVTEDGAPSGRKDFLVWNPPLKDPMDPTLGRTYAMTEATKIMRFLMARGVRVILFCKVIAQSIGCMRTV